MARSTSPIDRPLPSLGYHRSDSRHSGRSRQGDRLGFEARHLTNDDGESITIYLPHR
ncbi:hypothetical protein [Sodalinema gerasimenkoae]|uniref:hypothetical protein n=1 Tax=Sodalinema gerasimenkoae TaxID=2862348 RepID=UPI00135AB258|nr:hypothetical protein [Sodalinema gerasimenkoae]